MPIKQSTAHDADRWPRGPKSIASVKLWGLRLASITETHCVSLILDQLAHRRGGWLVTPNLEILRQTTVDPAKRRLVNRATLCVPDGITLLWASHLRRRPLRQRVCGSSLIYSLTAGAAQTGRSVFFLGGEDDTAQRTAAVLSQRYPHLKIAGTYAPSPGFEHDHQQLGRIIEQLQRAEPDIVYVALGFPKAERLIQQLRRRHVLPRAWWLGVGISFSYVSGQIRRAPVWMQRIGLESFYRLAQEPRRLAKRYLWDGPWFAWRLLLASAAYGMIHLAPLTWPRQQPMPIRVRARAHDQPAPGRQWESRTGRRANLRTARRRQRSSTNTAASAH